MKLAVSTSLLAALILFLHLRPRDRLNGGIHPRHYQMASTDGSYFPIHKMTEPAALTRSIAVHNRGGVNWWRHWLQQGP